MYSPTFLIYHIMFTTDVEVTLDETKYNSCSLSFKYIKELKYLSFTFSNLSKTSA